MWALYVCANGVITIGLLGLLALLTGSPFVFPSLGPTAYLFFFSPLAEVSSPRNTILGHAIGLVCGYAAFVLVVASSPPFGVNPGVHGPRLLAAALSLSATGALMALLRVSHTPAGATTLIVSLGIISQPLNSPQKMPMDLFLVRPVRPLKNQSQLACILARTELCLCGDDLNRFP